MDILLTDLQIYGGTVISTTDLITNIWKDGYSTDLQIYGGTDILLVGTEPLVVSVPPLAGSSSRRTPPEPLPVWHLPLPQLLWGEPLFPPLAQKS